MEPENNGFVIYEIGKSRCKYSNAKREEQLSNEYVYTYDILYTYLYGYMGLHDTSTLLYIYKYIYINKRIESCKCYIILYIDISICVYGVCVHGSWAEPKFLDGKKKISQVFYFPNGYYDYNTILRFIKYTPL